MKKYKNTLSKIIFIYLSAVVIISGFSNAQTKALAKAQIIINSYSSEKDSIIHLGVLINLEKDWHIYWENPGDSGIPTSIIFDLPEGLKSSEIQFPIPSVFNSDEIINYGYADQVLLLSKIIIPPNYKSNSINISVKINSLICKDYCVPFDTIITLNINLLQDYFADKNIVEIFDQTKNSLPITKHDLNITSFSKSGSTILKILFDKNQNIFGNKIKFYPYNNGLFKNTISPITKRAKDYIELILEPDPLRNIEPKEVFGLLICNELDEQDNLPRGFEIKVPVKY